MRRPPVLFGALGAVVLVAAVVLAGAFSVPATAVSVDGSSISQASLDADLATIQANGAFSCYLEASVAVRSGSTAELPALVGSGGSGTYNTSFVDFWLSQEINNLLVEDLAHREGLALDDAALSAARVDLASSMNITLGEVAAATGQSAVCAPSGQSIIASLPSPLVTELVRAQAAGDQVLAHAAGYSLGQVSLERYYDAHRTQFETLCVSAIETSTVQGADLAALAIASGQSFASVAKADSTDSASAADGGALGCLSPTDAAYSTLSSLVKGLAVGQLSAVTPDDGSYLLLQITAERPNTFAAVASAVRGDILAAGAAKASRQLSALTKHAQVEIDPRYGRWSGANGVGIEPPLTPAPGDLLKSLP